ncbi:hypothetical protein ADL05_05415 [Nocardiopsis sp. NRRL B-16309]|nr:hypothetical protein ADL05_05415 [Nocardiopsis sp. NRRL B-16309]
MIRQFLRVAGPRHRTAVLTHLSVLVASCVAQGLTYVLLVPVLASLLEGDTDGARPWLLAMAGAVAACWVLSYGQQRLGYSVGLRLLRTLHHRVGDHVSTLPVGWFAGDRVGRLGHLMSKGVVDVMGLPAHQLQALVASVVTPVTVLAVLAVYDARLAAVGAVCVLAVLLLFQLGSAMILRADRRADASAVRASARVVEFARNQPALRAFGATGQGGTRLDRALTEQNRADRRSVWTALPPLVLNSWVVQAAFTILLVVAAQLTVDGRLAAVETVVLLVLVNRFIEPLGTVAEVGMTTRITRNSLDRIEEVLAARPLPEPADPRTPRGAAIELRDVGFTYPGADTAALDGVSLTVAENTTTALVGPSGSGKSTVIRLISRFFDPDAGGIAVGGVDVRDVAVEELMSRMSLVFQDVYLFEGTIRDNVVLARPGADGAAIAEAARLARLDEVVRRLPQGWDTVVGEGGARLSGGERQRVALARALLKDAPIVLLDEATAALDAENESAVAGALDSLRGQRTMVVIAHRPATVLGADQIVFLERGRVVERGTHEELVARGRRYARFWERRRAASGWRIGAGTSGGGR